MLTSIMTKIPVLCAGILFLAAAAIIYFRAKNTTRAEFIRIFKSAKYFAAGTILLCFVMTSVFGIFNHLKLRQSVHAIVSLNYSEASHAQNSNGTRYNMAEIICDEVVEKAIEKGALPDVTVPQLRECLSVYPCVQGGVNNESEYHISTEFAVEYHASKHTDHLDTENVIKLICSAYKEYYIEKYTDNFKLDSLVSEEELKTLEYMDVVAYLSKEASEIVNYLYGMAEKGPSFVTKDNTTFNSIAGKVFQFKETQIDQNLNSLILQNGIARDKAGYIDRLSYQNKNTSFDRQKNAISFDICNQAIAMYSEEMTRVVLVPTWDQSGKYYMGRTKVGIDELSVQATGYSSNVASKEKQIMDNNLIIGKMNTDPSDATKVQSVDALVDSIYRSIKKFEKEAITAGREFSSQKMNQCIAVSIYGTSLMDELKSLVVFAAFAYAALVLFKIAKRFPKKS